MWNPDTWKILMAENPAMEEAKLHGRKSIYKCDETGGTVTAYLYDGQIFIDEIKEVES
jgi:hypothetical protein